MPLRPLQPNGLETPTPTCSVSVRDLSDDAELDVPRKAHWGQLVPTYDLIVTMLEHDLYHAGEINRTRALLQDDDAWWKPDSEGGP